jgi:protein-L-isoaspartate(D-aspartate) O-methyltransferase
MSPEAARREGLIAQLERSRILRDPRIAAALRAIDRHRFVPNVALEEAYEDKALALKENNGTIISSISQPSMIVHMLTLLDVQPGHRVLEIGTGSGYNAALLAYLASPGTVVSVEIENDLLDRAREALDAIGLRNIVLLPAAKSSALDRPFDRIVVTACCSDIDPQWWRLLANGGKIVVPLDVGYGGERAIGFERDGNRLRSFGSYACAFVHLRDSRDLLDPQIFFRTRSARYERDPTPTTPLDVIAIQRDHADESLLEQADAVVARTHTLFALRRQR